jgi:hypothetical protein
MASMSATRFAAMFATAGGAAKLRGVIDSQLAALVGLAISDYLGAPR